jgi:hypothetical protein
MTTINDPKGEAGSKKTPMWLLPPVALEQTAWVHKLGNEKYGPFNWRATGVCATTYVSAILRHLNAWRDGEDLDPESGISHIAHIATSCNILMDAEACGTLQDDRNKRPAGLSREEAFQQLVGCDLGAPLSPVASHELDAAGRELLPNQIEVGGKLFDLPPVPEGYSRWVNRGLGWNPCRQARYQYTAANGKAPWSEHDKPLTPAGGRDILYIEAVKDPTVRVVDHDIKPGDRVTGRLVRGEDFSGTVANIVDIRGTKLFQFLDRASISEDEIFSLTHA